MTIDKTRLDSETRARVDAWENILTGMGVKGRDRSMSTHFSQNVLLDEEQLNAMYCSDGIGRRIIDCLVEDLTRKWFTVIGDTDGNFNKDFQALSSDIIEGLRWGLLHGGAVGVIGVKDGGYYEEPVNEQAIEEITHIHIFDRWRTVWTTADLYSDPQSPLYATPEFYTIFPINPATTAAGSVFGNQRQVKSSTAAPDFGRGPRRLQGSQLSDNPYTTRVGASYVPAVGAFRVHESRILRFDGTQVPLKERIRNRYWNHSYLQFVFDRVRGLGSAYSDIEHILNEFIMGSLSIDDFLGLVATGQDKLIQDRLNLFDMTKSVHNTAIFQKGEEYKRESATVSGLGDLVDKLTQAVSFVTGIPESILFGKSISGINTSSDMNIRRYYDKIKADAARILTKPMQKLVKYDMLAKKSRFKGQPLAEWSLDFPYPWELSEVETADLRNKQANTDKVYIDGGVVTPEEVAASRFAGDHYSIETKLLTDRSDPGYTELVEGRTASAEEKAAAAMESQRLALEAQAAKQQEGPTGKQEGATNEKDE